MPHKKKVADNRAPAKKRVAGNKPVGAFRYGDRRANIPTAEMQGLVKDEDSQPVRVCYPREKKPAELYRRNADYDPQLVWFGKEEEDGKPLTIEAAPIYVQEKISPQAIIEDLRRHCAAGVAGESVAARLFGEFNGLSDPDARVDFYRHLQNWTNRMILGDSLQVMTSLSHKENLRGKVQCFYMDPPYGIKYASNWQPSTKSTAVKSGDDSGEPEVVRAFRDAWKNNVHSYLSYLRDRLRTAKDLLTESGSAFVQISDENVHLVRCLMDEVFGRENFVSLISCKVTSGTQQKSAPRRIFDYLIWYAKDQKQMKFRRLFINKSMGEDTTFTRIELSDGTRRPMTKEEKANPNLLPEQSKPFRTLPLHAQGAGEDKPRTFEEKQYNIPANRHWAHMPEGFNRLVKGGRVVAEKTALGALYYFDDFAYSEHTNNWADTGPEISKNYVVQTSERIIERCMLMTTDPGDLVLDPTCGSGTTAIVAEQWGRRWITCDTSRVALALARARLMAKSYDYYYLADSKEGAQKEMAISGNPTAKKTFTNDIRHGFVCRRVPHITLGDIANNKNIDEIWQLWRETLQPLLQTLNAESGNQFEEWQVPAEVAKEWNAAAQKAHRDYQQARAERQKQMDNAIAKNARTEQLHDMPFADTSTVRVTGPFTVESLSPYRMEPTGDDATNPAATARPKSQTENETRFLDVVFTNLRATGVQTNKEGGHIKFEDLQPWQSGDYIQYEGRYTENGKTRRAAICVGPEYGTVGCDLLIKAAANARDMTADLLIVLGFAFEAHADSEMRNVGSIPVLRARMNADLQMADRLQTGKDTRDNLFVVFGEPDIAVNTTEDGQLQVKMLGLDIYNPATGEVKNSGADDIACWFIDTDYDEQSFFVRHAYFCGGSKNPHKKHIAKLKTALRAEIDEDAWNTLYGDISRPFAAPANGKIAVKAINHYGDEVIKVFAVGGRGNDNWRGGKAATN